MNKRIILFGLMAFVFAGCGKAAYSYQLFNHNNATIFLDLITITANNNKNIYQKNMQLWGVGWYEYSSLIDKKIYFVAEDHHGEIFKRRLSKFNKNNISDIFRIIFSRIDGQEISAPIHITTLSKYNKISNHNKNPKPSENNVIKNLSALKNAKFYSFIPSEIGFIQLAEPWVISKIIYAKKDGVVLYFCLKSKDGDLNFILISKK